MCLVAWEIVIVDSYSLPWDQLVGRHLNAIEKCCPEECRSFRLEASQKRRRSQKCDRRGSDAE